MATESVIRRKPALAVPGTRQEIKQPNVSESAEINRAEKVEHPGGDIKHGGSKQLLRFALAAIYTLATCCSYVPNVSVLQYLLTILELLSRSLWEYRCIGITETFTMPTWHLPSNPMVSTSQVQRSGGVLPLFE